MIFEDQVSVIVKAISEHQLMKKGRWWNRSYRCSCQEWKFIFETKGVARFKDHQASAVLAALDGQAVIEQTKSLRHAWELSDQIAAKVFEFHDKYEKLKKEIQRIAWEMVEEPDSDVATRLMFAAKLNHLATGE